MNLLLAHQGGWDEALLFVGPIALAFFIVRGLERRGRNRQAEQHNSEQKTAP